MPESIPDLPDEPLAISAPLAWQQAQKMCRKDPADDTSCLWNHGLWQFLRLMKLAGTAANRSSFYQRTIGAFTEKNPAAHILISGTADYAMLAQIALAAQRTGASPTVTVVDICETPLHLNRWYAERSNVKRSNIKINTVRSDMLEFNASPSFDMVCTDSFLGRFPQALWPQVAARWHALLRPGGRLLTASQLRPASGPERLVFDESQIIAFRNKVLDGARERGLPAGFSPEDLFEAVTQYCRHQSNYPLRSEQRLGSLLADAGFNIDELSTVISASIGYKGLGAPTVSSGGKFLCVVATRR
jgi:hypothetical protein